jgi:NOL1/NOP2/fmu family ribosome biogenesis protein
MRLSADWGVVETRSERHHGYGYRFFPHLTKSEGFFCAVFKKPGLGGAVVSGAEKLPGFTKNEELLAKEWIDASHLEQPFFWKQGPQYLLVEARHQAALQQLQQSLYLRMAGLALGEPKQKGWVPDHALAVSGLAGQACAREDLRLEQALAFLRRQEFELPDAPKGWLLLQYKGLGLGWAKQLGNRINNYYPPAWRILKT